MAQQPEAVRNSHPARNDMSYERLTRENAAVLLVDHQTGLSNGIQDQSVPEYLTAVTGLVKLAKAFKPPSVITTSAADGPNRPVLPVITKTLPNAPVVKGADGKQGEDGCEIRTDVFDTDLGENCG